MSSLESVRSSICGSISSPECVRSWILSWIWAYWTVSIHSWIFNSRWAHPTPSVVQYNPPNIRWPTTLGVCQLHYYGLPWVYMTEWCAITTVRGAEPAAWRGDNKRRWVEVTKSGMQKPHDFHFEAVAEWAPQCSSFNCTSYTCIQAFILFRIHTHILSTHIYFILYLLYAVLEVAASKYSPVRLFWCVCWFKINRRSSHHCQRTYR